MMEPVSIQTSAIAVTDTRLASTISAAGAKIQTVEHLMSACAGLGIDNLLVDINGEEVPILDGSSSSFVFLLLSAGIEKQKVLKKFMRVLKPVMVSEGDGESLKWAKFEPYDGYKLNFKLIFRMLLSMLQGKNLSLILYEILTQKIFLELERFVLLRM